MPPAGAGRWTRRTRMSGGVERRVAVDMVQPQRSMGWYTGTDLTHTVVPAKELVQERVGTRQALALK